MKKIATFFAFAALSFSLLGCNTVNGIGKDVERAGEKVQDASGK